jgi:hypothetical protein
VLKDFCIEKPHKMTSRNGSETDRAWNLSRRDNKPDNNPKNQSRQNGDRRNFAFKMREVKPARPASGWLSRQVGPMEPPVAGLRKVIGHLQVSFGPVASR